MSKTPKNTALRSQNPIEVMAKKNNAVNRKPKEAGAESKGTVAGKLSPDVVGAGKPVRKRVIKEKSVEVRAPLKADARTSTQASTRTSTHASTQTTATTAAKKPKRKLVKSSSLATTTVTSLAKNVPRQQPANLVLKNAVAGNTGKTNNRNKIKNGVAIKRVLQPVLEGNQQELSSSSSPPPVKVKAKTKTASAVNGSQKSKRALKKKVKVEIKE